MGIAGTPSQSHTLCELGMRHVPSFDPNAHTIRGRLPNETIPYSIYISLANRIIQLQIEAANQASNNDMKLGKREAEVTVTCQRQESVRKQREQTLTSIQDTCDYHAQMVCMLGSYAPDPHHLRTIFRDETGAVRRRWTDRAGYPEWSC